MKGYRTVLFSIVMTLAMGGTVQFSSLPPEAQHILTLLAMAWGFVAIFLRLVTTTPVGQKLEAAVGHDLGITPAQMQALLSRLPQTADLNALLDQGEKVIAAVEALKAAPATVGVHASGTAPAAQAAPPAPVAQ